jgi:hypothetical protein
LISPGETLPSISADVAPDANSIRVGGRSETGVEVGGAAVAVGGGLVGGGNVAGRGVSVGGGKVGGAAVAEGEGRGVALAGTEVGGSAVDPPHSATTTASRIRLEKRSIWCDLIVYPPRSSFSLITISAIITILCKQDYT